MKTLITPDQHAPVLAQWRGAEAKLWLFHASQNRMAIQLYQKGEPESLYIVTMGCQRISGPLRWEPAGIALRREPRNQWGESLRRVVDDEAGFELLCSDVALVRMPPALPPSPFSGLFVDPPDPALYPDVYR